MKKIKDICILLNGYSFKSAKYSNDGHRIIRITNVQKGKIEDKNPVFYVCDKKLEKYELKVNDILISLTGNVGRVGLVDDSILPSYLNQRVGCLRVVDKNVLPRYLFYILNSLKFENDCIKASNGVAQLNLSTEWIKEYEIEIPPLKEQQKFIKKMDLVNHSIDIRKKQVIECNNLVKSQFVEMFGEPLVNNKNWEIGTINDLIIEAKYGTSRPSTNGGKYKYLRMNNITYDGKLDIEDLKYIDIPDNELDKCTTKRGDILFNRTNSRDLVGKTCVYNLDEKMVIAGFIIRVRTNQLANPYFISTYLNTSLLKEKLYSMCKNASGQSNINAQELKSIEIYIPPIELQNKFANIVEQIDKQKFVSAKILEIIGKLSNLW